MMRYKKKLNVHKLQSSYFVKDIWNEIYDLSLKKTPTGTYDFHKEFWLISMTF